MYFAPKEQGQGLVEYAIILGLGLIVVIAVVHWISAAIGGNPKEVIQAVSTVLPGK